MNRLSIQTKITALIFFIVSFSLLLAGIIVISNFINTEEAELQKRALLSAQTIAEDGGIKSNITGSMEDKRKIRKRVETLRIIHHADYIVVMDMNHMRLSHPLPSLIGKRSNGSDEGPAFAELTYTTKAKGEVGTMIRAFVPIMNEEHQQVGVVLAGYKLPTFFEMIWDLRMEILFAGFISLLFGGWGSWLFASKMKKQMFNLEPHEIAQLVQERTETFNAMHEGIIAIDKEEKITIFNDKAKTMMGISGDVIGRSIAEVVPDTRLPEILELKKPIYNKELTVRNLNIHSNRIPIKVNNEIIGALAIFQDRTEVKKLAEELTGFKAFVSALRVQNHEHMNKLHTIAGLLQLGNPKKALEYVFQTAEEQEELTQFLSKNIKSESLSGLLISKVSRAKELGIHLHIDRNSRLHSFPEPLDEHDFVIIIGNLIENAFDSYRNKDVDEKNIYVSIEHDDEILSILVEDSGSGIPENVLPHIFTKGFSTKDSLDHGIGLYLIKEIVDRAGGTIQVESDLGKGTTFIVTI
ncbi:ATP-binding protein [Neobacillus sp. SAB-20_R2A]|uniref:ATP-binding protein n=1 Tax=Neobacillus sp. SAB-20_R2A TaxID=3120519 RepID=UPI003C6E9532